MNEKKSIQIAAVAGAIVLALVILVMRPFSSFEKQYPMTVASGSAAAVTQGSVATADNVVTPAENTSEPKATSVTGISLVDPEGKNLKNRIMTPEGFERTKEDSDSLGKFLRKFKLKKDGAEVLLYDKSPKSPQTDHVAVFKLPIEKEDLQQCADSIMRVYAEYFKKINSYDRIAFSLSDDFKARYTMWRQGYRIHDENGKYTWSDDAEYDDSEDNYIKFMRMVFAYSGTYNLEQDSKKIKENKIKIGDIFVNSGSPGHAVMVVDACKDASGRKAFLLAQGFMPAQEFHLLKNPLHEDDPWYYVDEISYPFKTPEYTFEKGTLRRPTY
ncbi:MAG: DUF4846 domain-containing protein [Eubacterium sp.]|nr:DUF4846 domain-containing protein [Eubacterium sp.]